MTLLRRFVFADRRRRDGPGESPRDGSRPHRILRCCLTLAASEIVAPFCGKCLSGSRDLTGSAQARFSPKQVPCREKGEPMIASWLAAHSPICSTSALRSTQVPGQYPKRRGGGPVRATAGHARSPRRRALHRGLCRCKGLVHAVLRRNLPPRLYLQRASAPAPLSGRPVDRARLFPKHLKLDPRLVLDGTLSIAARSAGEVRPVTPVRPTSSLPGEHAAQSTLRGAASNTDPSARLRKRDWLRWRQVTNMFSLSLSHTRSPPPRQQRRHPRLPRARRRHAPPAATQARAPRPRRGRGASRATL